MPRKSEHKPEVRVEVVLALLRREETAGALARRYQVSEATIYRWRDQFVTAGTSGVATPDGSGDQASAKRIEQLEREVDKRAQIIGELSIANGILKKISSR
jgi:transposase